MMASNKIVGMERGLTAVLDMDGRLGVVVHLVSKAKPDLYAPVGEIFHNCSDLTGCVWGDLIEGDVRHDCGLKDGFGCNNVVHDCQQRRSIIGA